MSSNKRNSATSESEEQGKEKKNKADNKKDKEKNTVELKKEITALEQQLKTDIEELEKMKLEAAVTAKLDKVLERKVGNAYIGVRNEDPCDAESFLVPITVLRTWLTLQNMIDMCSAEDRDNDDASDKANEHILIDEYRVKEPILVDTAGIELILDWWGYN